MSQRGQGGRAASTSTAASTAPVARQGSRISQEGPTAQLSVTIYEVHVAADRIGRIDPAALTAAAGAGSLDKSLATLGTGHPVYLANTSVRIMQDYIRIGASTPYITNSQTGADGEAINSVSYTDMGAVINIAGKTKPNGNIELDLIVELSTMDEGAVRISDKLTAPYFRIARMAYKGQVQPGKPFVLISADGATTDAQGNAIVYVARVTLGPLQ